jgi:hypothetical protein
MAGLVLSRPLQLVMARRAARWGLALALLACRPVAAQDQGLDPLLFARSVDAQAAEETDLQARGVQLYRIPLSLRLLEMRGNRWGVRLTFPVSVSAIRITSTSDLDRFVKGLGLASIIPGLELEIPIEPRLRLRPFAEVGFGNSTEGSETEVLYGAGVRARFVQPFRRLHLSLGGSAMHRKPETSRETYNGHSTFEAAVDAQWPLGFSIGDQAARGGVYTISRVFNGLELLREGHTIVLRRQWEAGISFATAPELRVWKVKLPWIAVGYQSGKALSGVRLYVAFPF